MKTKYIEVLARATVAQNSLNNAEFSKIEQKLSRSELREYARLLRRYLDEETLTVISTDPIDNKTQEELLKKFDKKYFQNSLDPKIGAGIVIVNNDDIIDLSVIGEIRRFIRSIS